MSTTQRPRWWVLVGWVLGAWALSLGARWWQENETAATLRTWAKPGDITMYSTEACVYCQKASRWLTKHHIPFSQCDVEKSEVCRSAYEAKGALGTPLFEVKHQWQLGFNADWMAEVIKPQAEPKTSPP